MGGTLRILSANLWNGRADAEAFADLVLALAVDVVAVQEISPEQAEALSAVMPYGELEPARDHTGMGIVMQRRGSMARIPLPSRDARVTTLDPVHWPQLTQPLEIVNVHISAPQVVRPVPGLWERPQQVSGLLRWLGERPSDQRVLIGDFNATPAWPAYRRIASHFTDAALAAAQRRGRPLEATWGPWHGSPRLARIDHGFVRGLDVEEFQVVQVLDSDHSAIVMDVSVLSDDEVGDSNT